MEISTRVEVAEFGDNSVNGDRIEILYDPAHPETVIPVQPVRTSNYWIWVILFCGLGAGGLVNELWMIRRAQAVIKQGPRLRSSTIVRTRTRPYANETWVEVTSPDLTRLFVRIRQGQDVDGIPGHVDVLGNFKPKSVLVLRDGDRVWWPMSRARSGYPVGANSR